MTNKSFNTKNSSMAAVRISNEYGIPEFEIERRLACTYDYCESVADYSSEKFINFFQNYFQEELQAEFEDIGYVTHSKVKTDTFTEAVDGLVKALKIRKPKEIVIILNTALLKLGINKADASLSHMYQIWYQDCNKVFVNKYASNTPPELSPMAALAA